jgi:DNA-binding transcriptional LysR family regulator
VDRFEAMTVFLAAAEAGSLSAASRKLKLPLATVSRKVSELEAHLNSTLLLRSAKGLELTPAGRSYVTSAKAILEQLTEAERAAAGEYTEPKGTLVVTAPILFGRLHVLPVVTQFLASYPDVLVQLVLTDRITHFPDDQVDIALRIGELPDSELIATRIGEVRRVMCAAPSYVASHGVPLTPQDLASHSVISYEAAGYPTSWVFLSNDTDLTATFESRLSVNTIDAAIDAGLAGTGLIRTLSYQIVDFVRSERLIVVLSTFEPRPRPVHLVYEKQSRLALKVRAFIDFAVPRLRERVERARL